VNSAEGGPGPAVSGKASQFLDWRKPALFGSGYELRDQQETLVARLQFDDKPAVSWGLTDPRAARVSAGDRHWHFRVSRHGFGGAIGFSATVNVAGDDTLEFTLSSFLSRATLRLPDGRPLVWNGKLTRGTTSVFADAEATPLVLLRSGSPIDQVVSHVELTVAGSRLDRWVLMAALGLYLRLLTGRTWR
jgi:hypothetical protein